MEQEYLKLSEVAELIRSARQDTDEFIEGIKKAIYINTSDGIKNPDIVRLHNRPTYFILQIDNACFELSKTGDISIDTFGNKPQEIEEANKILADNKEVIIDTLQKLNVESARYMVASGTRQGYMTKRINTGTSRITIGSSSITMTPLNGNGELQATELVYNVKDDEFFMQNKGERVDTTKIKGLNKIGVNMAYKNFKVLFANQMIAVNDLPEILITQFKEKNAPKL